MEEETLDDHNLHVQAFQKHCLTEDFWRMSWEKQPLRWNSQLFPVSPSPLSACPVSPPLSPSSANPQENPVHLFDRWIDVDEVRRIFLRSRLKGDLKLFKNSRETFLTREDASPFKYYLDRWSLIVNRADRYSSVLQRFCTTLSSNYFLHTLAVLYLTPPQSQAVRVHSDDQDVFVIQCWGSKCWRVFRPIVTLPYSEEMVGKDDAVDLEAVKEPLFEYHLEAGEILYIPRGFLHDAKTSNDLSLHITITVPTSDTTWGLCLERSIRRIILDRSLSESAERLCRSSFTRHSEGGPLNDENYDAVARLAINEIQSRLSLKFMRKVLEEHMSRINEEQRMQYSLIDEETDADKLKYLNDSFILMKEDMKCELNTEANEAVFLKGPLSLTMKICPTAADMIAAIATGKPSKVNALPCEDVFERVCVCEVLFSKGILRVLS